LYPKIYTSFWKFVAQFCEVDRAQFGVQIGAPKNTEQFRTLTRNHIFRPSKPITGMPKVVRQVIPVEMDSKQEVAYKQLKEQMYLELESGNLVITQNILSQIIRLRQITCCPAILDPQLGYGTSICTVLDHMEEDSIRKHCIWYTPYVGAISYMRDALFHAGYKKQVIFQAGMSMEELRDAEETFRSDMATQAICSISFAQSYELETASVGYFIGYDWDPVLNIQSEGRAKRGTYKFDFINMYYMLVLGTYDEKVLAGLSTKTVNTLVDMNDIQVIKTIF